MNSGNAAVSLRQQLHIDGTRRLRRHKNPKLPVVQVNPFMREREHTWCKDTSLPEFYDKPDVVHNNTEAFVKPPPTAFSTHSESQLTTRENRPILPLSQLNKPNNEAANVSVPVHSANVKVKLFDTPPPVDVVRGRKLIFPPTPRNECITPDNPIKQLPKHGFAPTIVDREKKTVEDSPTTKPTSLLNRERTQEFVSKQQLLRLRGMRLADGRLAPAPSAYFSESMPIKSLEEFYRHLVTSYNRGYAFSPTKSRMTANSYPTIADPWSNRKQLPEPLLALNSENLTSRLNSSMDVTESKSAFRILETAGKPTYIEQNLARDYNNFYKMSQSGTNASTGHHFTRFLKLKNYNPTQGELFIMVNKEQNRPTYSKNYPQPANTREISGVKTQSWIVNNEDRGILFSPDATTITFTDEHQNRLSTRDGIMSLGPQTNLAQVTEGNEVESGSRVLESTDNNENKPNSKLEITTTLPDINSNPT